MLRFAISVSVSLFLSIALASASRAITFADGLTHIVDSAYAWITVEDGPGAATTTVNLVDGAAILTDCVAIHSSVLNMSGGAVADELRAIHNSVLSFSGGDVGFVVRARDEATMYVSGGEVGGYVILEDSAQLEMTGGSARAALQSHGDSIATIRGGVFREAIQAYDASTVFIAGSGFEVDGNPVPYGDLTALSGILTGTLASGEPLDLWFGQGGGTYTGTITLIPEPATGLLFGAGLAGLALRRRLS